VKRVEKVIWFGLIPGVAGGYLLSRLLRPAPAARGLMGQQPAARAAADDLEIINGIGPVFARRLQGAGVRTFSDLLAASPERLLEIVQSSPGLADPDSWREQAARLLGKG
jgi:predicted flap endonuclease-1-like 5' DNA nuclease